MSTNRIVDRLPVSSDSALPAVAAFAMAVWVLFELVFRRGVASVLTGPLGSALGADMASGLLFLPVVTVLVVRLGRTVGIDRADWGYAVSPRAVGMGIVGFVVVFLLTQAITLAYVTLLDLQPQSGPGSVSPSMWVAALFLAVNGLVVPIAEELAWRGVIQTALMEAYGTGLAVALTAAAFVLKHLIVDATTLIDAAPVVVLSRLTALVLLSSVLCGLRARHGTASSTVAHLGMNVAGSALLVFA